VRKSKILVTYKMDCVIICRRIK